LYGIKRSSNVNGSSFQNFSCFVGAKVNITILNGNLYMKLYFWILRKKTIKFYLNQFVVRWFFEEIWRFEFSNYRYL